MGGRPGPVTRIDSPAVSRATAGAPTLVRETPDFLLKCGLEMHLVVPMYIIMAGIFFF